MENNIKDEYFELINSTLEKMKLLYVSGVDRIPFKDVQEYSPVLLLVEEKKPTEALTHEVSNTFPLRIIFAGINFSAEDCESIKKITTGIGLTSNQVDIVMGNAGELQENLRNKEVEVIVVFGREAVDALGFTDLSFDEIRGSFFVFDGTKVLATHHPRFFDEPLLKREAWVDIQLVMQELGLKRGF